MGGESYTPGWVADRITSIEVREEGEYEVTMAWGARLVSSRGYSERVRELLR